MGNPFLYSESIEKGGFCNRIKEQADLKQMADNGQHVLLFADRRMGKTLLIKKILNDLPDSDYIKIYIDLWPTFDEKDFLELYATELSKAVHSTYEKIVHFIKKFLSDFAPSIKLSTGKHFAVTFSRQINAKSGVEIDRLLNLPNDIANRQNKKAIIVFDEFQQILDYPTDMIERKLRSVSQFHDKTAYFFLGSKKSLLFKIFNSKNRPFYQSTLSYPIDIIPTKDWIDFIQSRFKKENKEISEDIIKSLCDLTKGHPFYTQILCHMLWEKTPKDTMATIDHLNEALSSVLQREDHAYNNLWGSLAQNQKRLLTALAKQDSNKNLYSSSFVQEARINSSAALHKALKALEQKDLILKKDDLYFIADHFFEFWLEQKFNL